MKKKKPLAIAGVCLCILLMLILVFAAIFLNGERELLDFEFRHWLRFAVLLAAETGLCLLVKKLFVIINIENKQG